MCGVPHLEDSRMDWPLDHLTLDRAAVVGLGKDFLPIQDLVGILAVEGLELDNGGPQMGAEELLNMEPVHADSGLESLNSVDTYLEVALVVRTWYLASERTLVDPVDIPVRVPHTFRVEVDQQELVGPVDILVVAHTPQVVVVAGQHIMAAPGDTLVVLRILAVVDILVVVLLAVSGIAGSQ